MKCLRCSGVLSSEQYEGIDVERCTSCQGFWIPGYRLTQIIEIRQRLFSLEEIDNYSKIHEAHDVVVHPATTAITCPECGTQLVQNRYNYASEVLIDRCPNGHGVWLDEGELEHIQMAVEEEEGELERVVAEQGLELDRSASRQLLREQEQYKFSLWRWFFWRD